jgi:Secretion system C-terminal sorting domain
VNALVNANELNVIDLQYHTAFPGPDPFNEDNPAVPGARVFYYGLSAVPYTILNGGTKLQHRFDYVIRPLNPNTVLVESLSDSKFSIGLNSWITGNTLEVKASVFALEDIPATELTIQIAVVERTVTGVTGGNGETSFESVVKAMLPDAAGTTVYQAWDKDEPRFVNQSWELMNVYDPTELRVVAFIQNEATGEVYQAFIDTVGTYTAIHELEPGGPEKSFMVFPNPATETARIRFFRETTEEITLQLYNNVGSLVSVKTIPAGTTETEMPVEQYPDGLYVLRLMSRNELWGIDKLRITK